MKDCGPNGSVKLVGGSIASGGPRGKAGVPSHMRKRAVKKSAGKRGGKK